jgi:site-specific DNA-methyltransferase (adenine-specific)
MGRRRTYATNAARQAAYRHRQAQHQLSQIPVVHGEGYTVYQGDARAIAPALQDIHALIADPPYGTGFDFTKPRHSHQPLQAGTPLAPRWRANIPGDSVPFDPTPWLGYPQVILWGANHYAAQLPPSPAWLVWDKRAGTTPDAFPDVELAWTNLRTPARLFTHLWRGIIRAGDANVSRRGKLHPAEKPRELLQWCVAKTTGTVLDPYMGSGTCGEACVRLGRAFVGIELDPHYFQVACDRLAAAARQGQLFPVSDHAVQADLLTR